MVEEEGNIYSRNGTYGDLTFHGNVKVLLREFATRFVSPSETGKSIYYFKIVILHLIYFGLVFHD